MMKETFCRGVGTVLLVALLAAQTVSAQSPDFQKMTPEERTAYMNKMRAAAQEDWQKMMDKLGLKLPVNLPAPADDPKRPQHLKQRPNSTNWYDEKGNTHVRSGWGNWTNYDETVANNDKLPDPLVLKNGKTVKNAATWWKQRRPEILQEYETEVFGKTPTNTPKVTFEVTATDPGALNGKAIKKTIIGHIDNSRFPAAKPGITITLYLPANASGPVPLMVVATTNFNFPTPAGPTALDMVLSTGWAYARVNTGDIQMDSGAGLHEGIIGLVNEGKDRQPNEWGVLSAWCWGLSRALDYFETDKAIDSKKIGIQGHSRWGKTALLAGALDSRWAIVFSSCSGSLGASLEKRNFGETIDNVAGSGEYHWMAGNFLKYGGNWQAMPVDAHDLIALVSPRPIFITGGTQDQWADPHGEFLACVAASPVYELLGKKGVGTKQMPAPDVSLIHGDLAFRNHEGGHTDLPDWPVFLEFAKKYFNNTK
ncbi:acetylxylan esterase [Larkinella harenae]